MTRPMGSGDKLVAFKSHFCTTARNRRQSEQSLLRSLLAFLHFKNEWWQHWHIYNASGFGSVGSLANAVWAAYIVLKNETVGSIVRKRPSCVKSLHAILLTEARNEHASVCFSRMRFFTARIRHNSDGTEIYKRDRMRNL